MADEGPQPDQVQLTVDLVAVGLDLALAERVGARTFVGAGVGVGGNFLNVMLLGGEHFSQRGFLTYDGRDQADGEGLFDVVDVHVFLRRKLSEKWRYDLGVQGALLLHFDDSDDDPGGASFVGVYLAPYWGEGRFQLGSLVRLGLFSEPDLRELGLNLEIIRGRFAFGG